MANIQKRTAIKELCLNKRIENIFIIVQTHFIIKYLFENKNN